MAQQVSLTTWVWSLEFIWWEEAVSRHIVLWLSCKSILLPDKSFVGIVNSMMYFDCGSFLLDSVISKVVPAPEAKPAPSLNRPKTPPPAPVPIPVRVSPTPLPPPLLTQAAVCPALMPSPAPALSGAGSAKAPVRSVVTETVSTYVVRMFPWHVKEGCSCSVDSHRQCLADGQAFPLPFQAVGSKPLCYKGHVKPRKSCLIAFVYVDLSFICT